MSLHIFVVSIEMVVLALFQRDIVGRKVVTRGRSVEQNLLKDIEAQ